MAEYFKLTNDNNVTVIDDLYRSAMLMYRGKGKTESYLPPTDDYVKARFYTTWLWFRIIDIRVGKTLKDLGITASGDILPHEVGQKVTYERSRELNKAASLVGGTLVVATRTDTPNIGCNAQVQIIADRHYQTEIVTYRIRVFVRSNVQNADVEFIIYSLEPKYFYKDTNIGMTIKNEAGGVVFDAMRSPLQSIGMMTGGVETWKNPAATYVFSVPQQLDQRNIFITCRSGLPYYSAYRIHSGGVDWNYTSFEPIMDFTQAGKITTRLMRQRNFNNSNSAYSYGGYFENILYCIQPVGDYFF